MNPDEGRIKKDKSGVQCNLMLLTLENSETVECHSQRNVIQRGVDL